MCIKDIGYKELGAKDDTQTAPVRSWRFRFEPAQRLRRWLLGLHGLLRFLSRLRGFLQLEGASGAEGRTMAAGLRKRGGTR